MMIQTDSKTIAGRGVSHRVDVKIKRVFTTGVIDTGSDLTIIRGDLFYHIFKKVNLKIENLETPQLKAYQAEGLPS